MGGLNLLKLLRKGHGRVLPGNFSRGLVAEFLQERNGGPFVGVEDGEGFPAFRAGHAKIDGVVGGRSQANRFAFAKVEVELAAG